jgi:hypothetical protein
MKPKDKRKYSDRANYLKQAVAKRRKQLMQQAIAYKGGQCLMCSYNTSSRALHFHHLDSETKLFGISARGVTRSWEKVKSELDKCVLLCANCHAEVHDGITQLPVEKQVEKKVNCLEALT